jgi:hypothetical protein
MKAKLDIHDRYGSTSKERWSEYEQLWGEMGLS